MFRSFHARGVALAVTFLLTVAAAKERPLTRIRPPLADFKQSLARVAFGPDGRLYAAYRTKAGRGETEAFHVVAIDPSTGRIEGDRSYPAPKTKLPRLVDGLMLSPDGTMLVYAELHPPVFVATFRAPTLDPVSASATVPLGTEVLFPHTSGITNSAVVLSAERDRVTRDGVRIISLELDDVGKVTQDFVFPFGQDGGNYALDVPGGAIWLGGRTHTFYKRDLTSGKVLAQIQPQRELHRLKVIGAGRVLGATDLGDRGWLQLFDANGGELAVADGDGCGFTYTSLSPDGRYGAAVCQRVGQADPDFGRTLSRQVVVFNAGTLRTVLVVPASRMTLKERDPESTWASFSANPEPAVFHKGRQVFVAVPDFSNSILIYSVTVDR